MIQLSRNPSRVKYCNGRFSTWVSAASEDDIAGAVIEDTKTRVAPQINAVGTAPQVDAVETFAEFDTD